MCIAEAEVGLFGVWTVCLCAVPRRSRADVRIVEEQARAIKRRNSLEALEARHSRRHPK